MYKNMAWGYQYSGWLIDHEGNVNYYNLPDDWHYSDESGIGPDDMEFNLSQTDTVIATVDPAVLAEKIKLIEDAAQGEISPSIHSACDAGVSVLYAYYYDHSAKIYRPVFLAQSGDFESHNESEAAVALTNWLKQFGVFWLN
jgi:hypothetical protein